MSRKIHRSWLIVNRYSLFVMLFLVCLVLPQTAQAASPVADGQAFSLNEDTSINITLTAFDADGDSLTYTITNSPDHASLTGTAPNLTYKPSVNYNGADYFEFKVNDGTADSNIATVSLTINPVDDAPALGGGNLVFAIKPEETSVSKTYHLPTVEVDGDALNYAVQNLPSFANLNPDTGVLSLTITHSDIQTYNVTFTVTDVTVAGLSQSKTVNLIIREAKTYYLDIDGVGEDGIPGTADDVVSSDANPGTAEQPWKTLNRAYTWYSGAGPKVQEGDTVLFRNGSYGQFKESTAVDHHAQHLHRTNWITYKAATGHSPVLTNILINNADHHSSPLYQPGESYLAFEGFNVQASVGLELTNYISITDCNITAAADPYEGEYAPYYDSGAYAISAKAVNDVNVISCDIHHCSDGFFCYGDDWLIKDNIIHRYGDDGIHMGSAVGRYPKHFRIESNHIYDCEAFRCEGAIYGTISGTFQIGEAVIQADTSISGIVNSVYSGLLGVYLTSGSTEFSLGAHTITGQTSGATLSNITKVDFGHTGGISTQSPAIDLDYIGNIIHDGGACGIKIESAGCGPNAIDDVTMINNLIYDTEKAMNISGTTRMKLFNNTFISNSTGTRFGLGEGNMIIDEMYNNIINDFCWYVTDSGGRYGRITAHGNNIFGNNPNKPSGAYPFYVNATELINTTPTFVDAANGNYCLAEDSVAIDFGDSTYAPTADIEGNLRDALPDAGCYEYGVASILFGDVNSDAEITAYDAALAAYIAVDLEHSDIRNRAAAEVSGDGQVTAYDAALIAQRAVGLIEKFPVEG